MSEREYDWKAEFDALSQGLERLIEALRPLEEFDVARGHLEKALAVMHPLYQIPRRRSMSEQNRSRGA